MCGDVPKFISSSYTTRNFKVKKGSIFQIHYELLGEAEEVVLMEQYKEQNALRTSKFLMLLFLETF